MFGKHMAQLTFSYMALNDLSSSISLSLRVHPEQLAKMLDVLCEGIRSSNEEYRDICSLGK